VQARAAAAARAAEAPAPAAGPYVVDVTEESFQTEVLDRSFQLPVLIVLSAARSAASEQLSPLLERLALESNGSWILARIDIDANPGLAQALQGRTVIPQVDPLVLLELVDQVVHQDLVEIVATKVRIAVSALYLERAFSKLQDRDVVRSATEIEQIFQQARRRLNEGLMIKDPESSYSPGRRGMFWFGRGFEMPPQSFTDAESYYATLLHELTHWTRHETRLNLQSSQHTRMKLEAAPTEGTGVGRNFDQILAQLSAT